MKIWNIPNTTVHIQVDWSSDSGWWIVNKDGDKNHIWIGFTTITHNEHLNILNAEYLVCICGNFSVRLVGVNNKERTL